MRLRTPQRCSSPPDDIAAPGETCPLRAACAVVQDMLSLKYGLQLDEADFVSKAKVRCDPASRLLPERLAEALNSEPALRVKDAGNERLLQLQLRLVTVASFAELRGFVRRWPGTACAVCAVVVGASGRRVQLVATYREAYGDTRALVARTWAKSTGRVGPLHTFHEDGFNGAVVIDPVIARVLRYESEPNRMLDLHIPTVSIEYDCVHKGQGSETELAVEVCCMLADLAPKPGNASLESAAARGCSFIADLMAQHLSNAALQVAACRALRGLVPACGSTLAVAEVHTAVEMVVAAMRRHSCEADVQEAACAVLAGITAGRNDLQSVVATNGGMEQVVGAMRQFPDAAELQTWACGALASLAANNPLNQSAITGSRGIDRVVAAMERHAGSASLQTMACGALGNMAANHQNNQAAIAAGGGLELVIATMRQHPDTVTVLLSAVGALWCLVKSNPENQSAVARAGGAELIVNAVERHAGHAALRAMASGALQVLVPGLGEAMLMAPSQTAGAWSAPAPKALRAVAPPLAQQVG